MEPIRIAHNVAFRTKFATYQADIWLGKYNADESYALIVTDVDDMFSQIAIPTRCLIDYGQTPPEGYCWVANYSENEGVIESLLSLGIIEPPINSFILSTGATWFLCKVLKTEAV